MTKDKLMDAFTLIKKGLENPYICCVSSKTLLQNPEQFNLYDVLN